MRDLSWMLIGAAIAGLTIAFRLRILTAKLNRATREMRRRLDDSAGDIRLAQWARTTTLTVLTVTGYEFSATLDELRRSEHGSFRTWNVPVYVTLCPEDAPDTRTPLDHEEGHVV